MPKIALNKLLIILLLIPMVSFGEDTIEVKITVNKNEQLWECKAPSGNTYYVKLEKGKNYSITEVCNAFVNQARRDFPDLVEYVPVPAEASPRVSPQLLPPPCSIGLEGVPCLKGM